MKISPRQPATRLWRRQCHRRRCFDVHGLVVALNVWNEYLLATVFLSDQEKFTVVTSYQNFSTRFSQDWSLTSAAAMMMVLPILATFFALQRQFIEGLTQGSVKG